MPDDHQHPDPRPQRNHWKHRARRRDPAAAPTAHARQRTPSRYREYLDYHEGRRGGPPRRGRERVHTFNYARAIVEKGASYLVTDHRPLVHPLANGVDDRREAVAAEALLHDTWEAKDLARLDIETEIDTATLGDGAFKMTWDEQEQRIIVSSPDVQGLFVWWHGDDVRRVHRVAARYEVDAETLAERTGRAPRAIGGAHPSTIEVVEAKTADRFDLWVQDEMVESRANPYGAIPFIIYPNLPRTKQFWGISDIEPIKEPLEELNRALTQLGRILELSGNPIAVLENVEEAHDIAVQPGAVWELPDNARAYLLDLLQGGGVRLHADYVNLVYRTLHDMAETPKIAFGDGQGDRFGISLQMELDPLLRRVGRKRLIRTAAMRRCDALILRVLAHHTGQRFDGIRTDIEWGPIFSRDPGALLPTSMWTPAPGAAN